MRPAILLALFLVLLTGACDTVDSGVSDDPLVVEAFLFAGEPVTSVRINRSIPLASTDTVAPPSTTRR